MKQKKRSDFLLMFLGNPFLLLLLVACNLPLARNSPFNNPSVAIVPEITLTSSSPDSTEHCGWTWATQSLPELSAEVQSALVSSGFQKITTRAEAYGENCLSQENEILYFAALETAYHIDVEVDNLSDLATLGVLLEQILIVLDSFPPGSTPGPQPGHIGIRFFKDAEESNLWFSVTDGKNARAGDLHGAELFAALMSK